jgi:hypothetical protein
MFFEHLIEINKKMILRGVVSFSSVIILNLKIENISFQSDTLMMQVYKC